jgi:hypothetical protein
MVSVGPFLLSGCGSRPQAFDAGASASKRQPASPPLALDAAVENSSSARVSWRPVAHSGSRPRGSSATCVKLAL